MVTVVGYDHQKEYKLKPTLLCALLIIWAGLILGVSFIATPVKFMAPHLSMPVALEIGKATFHVFNKVEWGICALIILCSAKTNASLGKWFFTGGLLGLLSLESFWLLPCLDIRADEVIAGKLASPSLYHSIYIGFEILKIILAFAGAKWLSNQKAL